VDTVLQGQAMSIDFIVTTTKKALVHQSPQGKDPASVEHQGRVLTLLKKTVRFLKFWDSRANGYFIQNIQLITISSQVIRTSDTKCPSSAVKGPCSFNDVNSYMATRGSYSSVAQQTGQAPSTSEKGVSDSPAAIAATAGSGGLTQTSGTPTTLTAKVPDKQAPQQAGFRLPGKWTIIEGVFYSIFCSIPVIGTTALLTMIIGPVVIPIVVVLMLATVAVGIYGMCSEK
jgi:hypothetical protein